MLEKPTNIKARIGGPNEQQKRGASETEPAPGTPTKGHTKTEPDPTLPIRGVRAR